MKKVTQSYLLLAIVLPMLLIGICTPERSVAEVSEVRIAKQYGLTYLPLIIIEEQKLVVQQLTMRLFPMQLIFQQAAWHRLLFYGPSLQVNIRGWLP